MLKMFRWIWGRIADCFTAIDILDWMEWKTWVVYILGGTVTASTAAFLGAPGWAIFALGIASALLIVGGVLAWQNFNAGRPKAASNEKHEKEAYLSKPFPVEGFISMHSAADSLYQILPNRYILERASEVRAGRINDADSDRQIDLLKRIARHIAKSIPVHGKNCSTGVFGQINNSESYGFSDDLTGMTHHLFDKSPDGRYADIGVRVEEIEAFKEKIAFDEAFSSEMNGINGGEK
jgi:hypothetical protein